MEGPVGGGDIIYHDWAYRNVRLLSATKSGICFIGMRKLQSMEMLPFSQVPYKNGTEVQ